MSNKVVDKKRIGTDGLFLWYAVIFIVNAAN